MYVVMTGAASATASSPTSAPGARAQRPATGPDQRTLSAPASSSIARSRSAAAAAAGSRRPAGRTRGSSGADCPSRSVGIPRYTGPDGDACAAAAASSTAPADLHGGGHPPRRLGHRREHRGLVARLVQDAPVHALAAQRGRDVGGDDQHRRSGCHRLAGGAERVGGAGPGRHERHSEPPCGPRIAVGGVRRGLLVTDPDEADRRTGERLPDRQVVDPGQAERDLDPEALERLHHPARRRFRWLT